MSVGPPKELYTSTLADLFIPSQTGLFCESFSHDEITARILFTTFPQLYCTATEWTGASLTLRERKCPSFETAAKCVRNLASLDWQFGIPRMSYKRTEQLWFNLELCKRKRMCSLKKILPTFLTSIYHICIAATRCLSCLRGE